MVHFTMIMADTIVLATHTEGQWHIKAQDSFDGKAADAVFTCEEFAAVMALFCEAGESKFAGYDVAHLYSVAEPAMERLGVRLIP